MTQLEEFREQLKVIRDMANGALAAGELGDRGARNLLADMLLDEVVELFPLENAEARHFIAFLLIEKGLKLRHCQEREADDGESGD